MRVLYDYQAFDMQRIGGVSRCFVEIYKHLPKNVEAEFALLESDNVYMQEEFGVPPMGYFRESFIAGYDFKGKGRLFKFYNRLRGVYYGHKENELYSIKKILEGNYDVLHPTYFGTYFLPYLKGKPFVLTIHDMIPELYPQYFDKTTDCQIYGRKVLAPLAAKIIAVSEQTKNDIVRILRVPENKIEVVYHGSDEHDVEVEKCFFDFPYLLYVGDRGLYKNFLLMCHHLLPFLQQRHDIKIVCTGPDFAQNEIAWMKAHNMSDRFIHLFVKKNSEMASLYKYAQAFIYSSEYEGFGIPILEAYKAQCPVVLNNSSCFPEIAGDAAVYFDMNRETSNLVVQISHLLEMSKAERQLLIDKQNERIKQYSWSASAEKLMKIYESVL